ncbi:MAG TPA: MFS transporter [Candidatus Dormibacteraeota bacterium]|nr:MFS transporter [Candidatus Dormibacteraeota bacterium]
MTGGTSARRVLAVCGVATFLVGYGGSILFIALPGVAAEFHAGVSQLAGLGATLSIGSAIALPLAALADRHGRGAMAAVGIAGFSLAALATAVSHGLAGLAAARLLAVCFETLVVAVTTAAALEAVRAGNRGRTAAFIALCGGAGAALTVVAYPLFAPHWRVLYLAAALGLPLAPLGLLIPRGAPHHSLSRFSLLLGAPWRNRVAVLVAASAMGALLYEPANFFGTLFGSQSLHLSAATLSGVVAASGVAAAAGYAAGGMLTDRAGRRVPCVVLSATSAVVAALAFTPSPAAYIAAGVVSSGLAGGAAPMIGAWTAELVPSRARVTAFTTLGVAGSMGGVAGLQLASWLTPRLGLGGSLGVAAMFAVAGALALLALPETRGLPLPD